MAAHVFSGGGLVMFGFNFPASGSLPVILSSLVLTHDHLSLEFKNITNNGNTETTNSIATVTYSKSDYGIEYVPYSHVDIRIRNTIEYLQYSD